MKKILLIIFLGVLTAIPLISLAAGLVPCGGEDEAPCTLCHIFLLLDNILNFLFFTIVPPLAILMIAIGGAMFLFSSGNPKLLGQGKEVLKATLIGLFIIYGSWVLVKLFFLGIGVAEWTGLKEGWFQIDCPTL